MDIKEVLNLPHNSKVKCNGEEFSVFEEHNTKILKSSETNHRVTLTLAFINADYELVRKKLNFFEAMALVSEGKTVENNIGYIYKRYSDGLLASKHKAYVKEEFDTNEILVDEILSDWYEVTDNG